MALAGQRYENTGKKQRLFTSISYGARSWDRARRVIVKAEHSAHGANPRLVVTNLPQTNQYLYDKLYCARGDMENRIKDQQLDMFAGRTSKDTITTIDSESYDSIDGHKHLHRTAWPSLTPPCVRKLTLTSTPRSSKIPALRSRRRRSSLATV